LDDPSLDPFWRACQDEEMLVLVHPVQPAAGERLARYGFVNLIGNPFEVWLAGASILLGGVLERFPALTVCLVHGGGALPYQIGRLERGFAVRPESRAVATVAPRELLGRLYFDTLTYHEEALRYLLALVGPERVLFGSDTPFPIAEPMPVAAVTERIAHLPEPDQALVLGGNAARLLGIAQ
jgi:aminocarboxymuconate-semialdehyde decarboxylase